MGEYDIIIQKARELSEMIENHAVTVRYRESLEKMKHDVKSQRLLADLVRIGGELQSQDVTGTGPATGRAELEILKEEFEKNDTVRNHILAQKEYLNLIKMVQDRIKSPVMNE